MMKRKLKRALSLLLAFAVVLTTCIFAGMPLLTVKSHAEAPDGALKVDENGDFTVLQIADVQGCYPLPDQWINTIRLAVSTAEPDLIVMTGDNVVSNYYSEGIWHTWDQIVREFYDADGNPIPFAVTFGNHDTESNGHSWISQDYYKYLRDGIYADGNQKRTTANNAKGYYKDNENFTGYTNFVDYDKTPSNDDDNHTHDPNLSDVKTMGTGYIDIYSNDGSTVVERVILLNSGTYDDRGGYGKPGYNTKAGYNGATQYNNDDAYNGIVAAVNSWTSDTNIKCIGFQHIPFQEFYMGDSDSTRILKSGGGYDAYSNNAGISGAYNKNTSNSTVSGVFTEQCCCSFDSTRALYNAYAKDNVYGVFFGHDHGNTLTGVATVDGNSLRMGYGGGINTEWNGAGVSAFSYYTLNADYSGSTDTQNFKKTDNDYASYIEEINASYGPKTHVPSTGITYIKEVGANNSWGIFKSWDRAIMKTEDDYDHAIDKMANDSGANADLNKGCGSDTDYICLGYDTTTDVTQAVTGVIGFRTTSSNHPETIQVTLQNGHVATYYLDDNNTDLSGGISDYYTLVYYTRDPIAGPPITNLYVTYEYDIGQYWSKYDTALSGDPIPNEYKVCSWVADDLSYLKEWQPFDFNTGCGGSTPYIYVEYASLGDGIEDVTRAYYDIFNAFNKYGQENNDVGYYTEKSYEYYDAKRNEVAEFIETLQNPYSPETSEEIYKSRAKLIEGYEQLVIQQESTGKQVKIDSSIIRTFHVAVPETIYLTPDATSAKTAVTYLNNKIENNNLVKDGTTSASGKFELTCEDCVSVKLESIKQMSSASFTGATRSTLNTFECQVGSAGSQYDMKNGYTFTPDSSGKISGTIKNLVLANGIAPGVTAMLEWEFTVTRANYTDETVYAYTTVYSPYISPVGAGAGMKANGTLLRDKYKGYMENIAWWAGVQGYDSNWAPDNKWKYDDLNNNYQARAKTKADNSTKYYLAPLTDGVYTTGENHGSNNWLVQTTSKGNNMDPSIRYAYDAMVTEAKDWTFTMSTGYTALLAVDSSRFSNLNQIPNLSVSAMITDMENARALREYGYSMQYTGETYHGCKENDDNWNNTIKPCTTTGSYSSAGMILDSAKQNYTIEKRSYDINFAFKFISQNKTDGGYGTYVGAAVYCPIFISCTDKSTIRQTVGDFLSRAPQLEWYTEATEFNAYMNEFVLVCQKLGNPANSSVSTADLGVTYGDLDNHLKRTYIDDNGQEQMFYTIEENFGLRCVFDGFNRTGYVVDPIIVGEFKFYGEDSNGISSMDTIKVQPYNLEAQNYYYQGFMDGEGFDPLYGRDPSALKPEDQGKVPMLGDPFSTGMLGNLYDDFGVNNPTNYGHIVKETMDRHLNEFYFYYHKGNDFRTLTFDLDGGNFTYSGTNHTGTSWKVKAYEDDEFKIEIKPTRTGYYFDGWELVEGSSGTYDDATATYTYGSANGTLKAKWLKQTMLYIDSNGGASVNNLIYFKDGLESTSYSGLCSKGSGNPATASYSYTAAYDSNSDITVSGKRSTFSDGVDTETTHEDNNLCVYLEYDKEYTLSYTSTNPYTEFYLYKGSIGTRSRSLNYYSSNGDGTYSYSIPIKVGSYPSSYDGGAVSDGTWHNADSSTLTGVYNFRLDQNYFDSANKGDFTITDLKIVENTESTGIDNKIMQIESHTRFIESPEERSDEKVFGGWEVYNGESTDASNFIGDTDANFNANVQKYLTLSGDGYIFTYGAGDITLKAMWIDPIGVAMDNMFNYYAFRYNDYSKKIAGSDGYSTDDIISFSNADQTIYLKDDGQPGKNGTSYDTYTGFGGDEKYYNMVVPKIMDEFGTVRTASNYLLTMDIKVDCGKARFLILGYNSSYGDQTVLTNQYVSSNTSFSKIVTIDNDVKYLQLRFGYSQKDSEITYSNIRLVPVSVSDINNLADDEFGYAMHISDEQTITYNTRKNALLTQEMLYSPTRTGYTFINWQNDAEADTVTGTFARPRDVIETHMNLWSYWSADEYLLRYYANVDEEAGETASNMPVNNKEGAPAKDAWTLVYDKATSAASDEVINSKIPLNSDANKIFIGWSTTPTGELEDGSAAPVFYPNTDVSKATIDGWYQEYKVGKYEGKEDYGIKKLYAQWFDATDANEAAAKEPEGQELHQLETDVVRGVEVNSDGSYKSTISDTTITKFDAAQHKEYTDAITAFNTAKSDVAASVTAVTVKALTDTAPVVPEKAAVLEENINDVNADYNNYFVVKNGDDEQRYSLADMNLNHYATDTLDDASAAKTDATGYAYSVYTDSTKTLRKAFDSIKVNNKDVVAQDALNSAVESMAKDFVSKAQLDTTPEFAIYETTDAIAGSDISGVDGITGVNNVVIDKGAKTYYLYTNNKDAKIVVSIDDIASGSRTCYPTSVNSDSISITEDCAVSAGKPQYEIKQQSVLDSNGNSRYKAYLDNQLGTSLGTGYYDQKDVIVLKPNFETTSGQTAKNNVTYTFNAHNDSLNKTKAKQASLKSGNDLVNGTKSIADAIDAETTGNEQIKIVVSYHEPAGSFNVTYDQWANGTDYDYWLTQFHLFRSSGGASNWEIPGWDAATVGNLGKPINLYAIEDTVFDTNPDKNNCNYCSFTYTFTADMVSQAINGMTFTLPSKDTRAFGQSFKQDDQTEFEGDLNIAGNKQYMHEYIKNLVGNSDIYTVANLPAHKFTGRNAGGSGTGFILWPGTSSWSFNYYPASRAYTYVHLIDRWGNTVDKIIPCPNLDSDKIQGQSLANGSAVITEDGGSGIDTVSINSKSLQIITDENSELNGNVYTTTGNTVKIYTGEPNKSYTLTMADVATNKSTATVKTDADGYLEMTFEDKYYVSGVYSFMLNDFEINLYAGVNPESKGRVVNVQYDAEVGQTNTYNVKVEDRANMLQFMELEHGDGTGTRSFDRYDDNVTIVSYDKNGNVVNSTSKDLAYEIWTVTTALAEGDIGVRVKESGSSVWEDKSLAYHFDNEYAQVESGLISAELAKTEGKKGGISFTVVTGADVKSVQLKNQEGETATVKASDAKVNADGTLTFTGRVWFHGTGTRTATVRILDAYGWTDAAVLTYEINQ